MFSSLSSTLATKMAKRKLGLAADNFTMPDVFGGGGSNATSPGGAGSKKYTSRDKDRNSGSDDTASKSQWPALSVQALPFSVQAWLTPPPPPVPVAAACPRRGDRAPVDRGRKLVLGDKPVLVVFLRCVGCAFAQKQFLALRSLALRHAGHVTCIAVSHASAEATEAWLKLLGGPQSVQVIVDEDRSVYAAWGLGLGNVWTVLHPGAQVQAWKEKGWLGQTVAASVDAKTRTPRAATAATAATADASGPATVLGNKWQQAGAFAVNRQGTVLWGQKAERADDVLDLDQAAAALGL